MGPYLYYVWNAINSWILLELHIVPFAEHAVIICFRYGSPILNIKWHQTLNSTEPKLITADKHIVRVWDPNTVSSFLSILLKCFLHYYSWCVLTLPYWVWYGFKANSSLRHTDILWFIGCLLACHSWSQTWLLLYLKWLWPSFYYDVVWMYH